MSVNNVQYQRFIPQIRLPISTEKIIEQCRKQFINIMPNTLTSQQVQAKPIQTSSSTTYNKDTIKQVMRLLSVLIQLTMQNCVLTSDPKIRSQSYRIIVNFRNLLSRDFGQFQAMITHQGRGRLPQYDVDCKDFLKRDVILRMPPQVSLYQEPLLFYNYSKVVQQELLCTHSKQVTRAEKIELIKKHVPFFDIHYIPLIAERLQSKAKFTQFEDRCILLYLKAHGRKELSKLKQIYFPNRPQQQVINRIKNLYAKQVQNSVKTFKNNEFYPLSSQQIDSVIHAYKRYGTRWPVIAKYYQIRTPDFLQSQYSACPKMLKRRRKQNITQQYDSLRKQIQSKLNKNTNQKDNNSDQDSANYAMDVEQESLFGQNQLDKPGKYKIINHYTFLCEQI